MINKNSQEKELSDIGVKLETCETVYLNKTGKSCKEHEAVAKIVKPSIGNASYYVKHRRGELFDPYGIDELKAQSRDTLYKKVNKKIFDNYTKYLDTRRSIFLIESRRDFIQGGL